jgi:hypothetical protein
MCAPHELLPPPNRNQVHAGWEFAPKPSKQAIPVLTLHENVKIGELLVHLFPVLAFDKTRNPGQLAREVKEAEEAPGVAKQQSS